MSSLEIMNNVFFVGYVDWEVRNFHGYTTHRGTSYNSYIVIGEKTVLIDTVKRSYYDEYLENIKTVCNLEDIDYLIVNHVEPETIEIKFVPRKEDLNFKNIVDKLVEKMG
ncbi:hypothetical protein LCGC14_0561520 [marine sediment metagenome]|uniref:Flavodoxin-like domain-containing protein n=1 Tax=marine sediment metagenome TaxID=412755 RepID=A0A0F9RLR8_9ZZZZ